MKHSKQANKIDDPPISGQKVCQFHVKLNGYFYEFDQSGIVTNQIISIGLNVKLNPGTTVSICYCDADMDFCVKAEVLDCEKRSAGNNRFIISMRLYPEMEDNNKLLLLAIRKYVDRFDHCRLAD